MLKLCLETHEECNSRSSLVLPTRILRILDDSSDRAFLHEPQDGDTNRYVALSYCWGETEQIKLLSKTRSSFINDGIAIASLPKSIQDAILVTRQMSIPYLWIDSLCIIQDDAADKTREIVTMPQVYKNAVFTISAAASPDCGDGFLQDREEVIKLRDMSVRLPFNEVDQDNNMITYGWVSVSPDPNLGHQRTRFSQEIINTRAWTYQESCLSSRLLIFGSGPPQWRCMQNKEILGFGLRLHSLEIGGLPYSKTAVITIQGGRVSQEGSYTDVNVEAPPSDDIDRVHDWRRIISNYASRKLTYQTDKLLALSGLAYEYHQLNPDDTYLAGLWRNDLPYALLWRVLNTGRSSKPDPKPPKGIMQQVYEMLFTPEPATPSAKPTETEQPYIVPSWSPLSREGDFRFMLPHEQPNQIPTLVTIHDAQATIKSPVAPFGQISSACIDLTGPMCKMHWSELTSVFMIVTDGGPHIYWDAIVPDNPAWYDEMCMLQEPSFNPQSLTEVRVVNEPVVPNGAVDPSANTLAAQPARQDVGPAPLDLPMVKGINDVLSGAYKHKDYDALPAGHDQDPPPVSTSLSLGNKDDELTFWFLELEHSKTPAGLLLRRVHGNVFERVGYFVMNRGKDPTTLFRDWHHVSGPINWGWEDMLKMRRIYLI